MWLNIVCPVFHSLQEVLKVSLLNGMSLLVQISDGRPSSLKVSLRHLLMTYADVPTVNSEGNVQK